MKQEFIRVGRIVNAHGIRGEVRVQPRRVSPALADPLQDLLYRRSARHPHRESRPQGAGAAEAPRRGRYERRPDL